MEAGHDRQESKKKTRRETDMSPQAEDRFSLDD
jgi:hypothetical protein